MAQRSLNRRSRRDDIEEDEGREPTSDHLDDDDEPPRRRGRSRQQEPDEDDEEERKPRSRRSIRDDEDDEEPQHSRPRIAPKRGWGGYKEARKETRSTDYVENYKLPESAELIKFLDEEPFAVYNEHWIEKARKKSWACIGDDCPLCNTGDRSKTFAMMNIIDLREGADPVVSPLKASPMVADLLEEFANDKKTSPLNRDDLYFSVQKKGGGKNGRVQVIINPVKARDLQDDWDVAPLSRVEIEDFERQCYTEEDVVTYASRKTLKAVADEMD